MSYPSLRCNVGNETGMAPTFCNRCGDAVEEQCDPKDELAELDALLERLTLKRYDLKRKVNRFHSPIVRQLPPDVTSTIFEFCLPDFMDHPLSPYTREDLSLPLSLGAICSYWRNVAWSTPSLWSSLVVLNPSEYNSHRFTGIAQDWLARSGQLPLSIRILSTFYNRTVLALVDIINQYSIRWSDLDLYIPDHYYQHFRATDNHAPLLKSIRFYCTANANAATARKLKFQLKCPRLERATLSYCQMGEINIQWDNLTHLTLYAMSIIDSFLILRKTPRLVFCRASGFCSHDSEQSIGAPVITSLRSLQLQHTTNIAAEKFLDNLIAPDLEEFNLPLYYIPSIEVVISFLRRSICSLRSLSMVFSILPQYHFEDFTNLLQSMHSLTTLSISSITTLEIATPEEYHPRNILQLVAKVLFSQGTPLQQGFLPNLKILEYTGKLYLHTGNYDDLYPLPPADNAVHGPLQLLKLDLFPTIRIPRNVIAYISSLAERGVTVNVLSDLEDILQSSIDYYKCREDFLCRRDSDWTDNFDSTLFP